MVGFDATIVGAKVGVQTKNGGVIGGGAEFLIVCGLTKLQSHLWIPAGASAHATIAALGGARHAQ